MMNFEKLHDFIQNKMRMSHIYQPVMIMTLLENNGNCHERTIAEALLKHDESQIEYYEKITRNMVGKVLQKNGVVSRDRKTRSYSLFGFTSFSGDQTATLMELCEKKLNGFLDRRGNAIFNHRRKSSGVISGTLKFEVLKRAKFRCELCGISAEIKALEVDHIIPRNRGGEDDISNLQALCFSCNSMKRDSDDTDFRGNNSLYANREPGCLFCEIKKHSPDRVLRENNLAYSVRDGFPVTQFHSLIIPKRHVSSYFELGQAEINSCSQLINEERKKILELDPSVDGFNVGANIGSAAGQTIFHCHIHLIPRRTGDMAKPRGGVRHVIPEKANY